ncbi:hypothetical protein Salat_1743800 [Sesamum alatum]|uniref:Uncharacterized protein n=1 Tax=Sesamum alatum TaxID=300844 RepID=A0AAE1Y896_9LAMI|nr:hypothetical protein Salat_1743800 [Sesamum alatum]
MQVVGPPHIARPPAPRLSVGSYCWADLLVGSVNTDRLLNQSKKAGPAKQPRSNIKKPSPSAHMIQQQQQQPSPVHSGHNNSAQHKSSSARAAQCGYQANDQQQVHEAQPAKAAQ